MSIFLFNLFAKTFKILDIILDIILNMEDNTFTPEELAWRLILDENVNSAPLIAFSDENSKEIMFEILITIYIEMIFNYSKLKYLENQNVEDLDNNFDNFNIDLNQININDLTNIFCEKFTKLKFILNVSELSREEFENTKKNRYCTVLLKDLESDKNFFELNKEYFDSDKRYHFILNNLYKTKEELRDIFCTFRINSKYFKINFY